MKGFFRDLIGRLTLPLIQGSSSVIRKDGCIIKYNHPTLFVRFLHLLFFQRWLHPYEIQEYLFLATYRRRIANLVLEFALGKEGLVVLIDSIIQTGVNGPLGISACFIDGGSAAQSPTARKFFETVVEVFLKAGLPTWQINPKYNPRAWTNAICQNDGFVIIDLESQIPNLFVPWAEWQTAWKNGNLVPFDEFDFDKLWAYVHFVESQGWSKSAILRREVANALATFKQLKTVRRFPALVSFES